MDERKENLGYRVALLLAVFIYCFVLFLFCYLRFNAFGYYDWDLAVNAQAIWNLTRLEVFSSLLGVNFFGHHAHFLSLPIAVVYKLFPHPLTLLFLQTAALGLASIPLFFLSRRILGERWALLTVCLYLLHQAVGYSNIYEFHFTSFAPIILFSMFYFFFIEKYTYFLSAAVMALLCQENFALLIFMFGLFAMYSRRSLRWWLPLLAGSVLYFLFCTKVLLPGLNPDTIQFVSIYSHWGKDYGEILRNLCIHPTDAVQYMFTSRKIGWLLSLFAPLSFIPLLSPGYLLLALPVFLQRLLSNRPQETMLMFHYQAEILPFVFLALIFGIKKMLLFGFIESRKFFVGVILLIIALIYAYALAPYSSFFNVGITQMTQLDQVKRQWVQKVPAESSAMASFEFLSHLTNRTDLYSFHYVYTGTYILSSKTYEHNKALDVVLVDFDDPFLIGSFYDPAGYKRVQKFLDSQKLSVDDVVDNMVFFSRGGEDQKKLYQVLDAPPRIPNPLNVMVNDSLRMAGYDVARKGDRLKVVLYWQVLKRPSYDLASVFIFSDTSGLKPTKIQSPACYRIFPTQAWNENTWVVEYKYLLIPSIFSGKDFSIDLGFKKHNSLERLPPIRLTDFKGE